MFLGIWFGSVPGAAWSSSGGPGTAVGLQLGVAYLPATQHVWLQMIWTVRSLHSYTLGLLTHQAEKRCQAEKRFSDSQHASLPDVSTVLGLRRGLWSLRLRPALFDPHPPTLLFQRHQKRSVCCQTHVEENQEKVSVQSFTHRSVFVRSDLCSGCESL